MVARCDSCGGCVVAESHPDGGRSETCLMCGRVRELPSARSLRWEADLAALKADLAEREPPKPRPGRPAGEGHAEVVAALQAGERIRDVARRLDRPKSTVASVALALRRKAAADA